jgi:hypothetical protein
LNDGNADLDITTSPNFLLKWLNDNHEFITTIDAIVPTTNDNELLDLYLYCILSNKPLNYDFVVPRSSASYTAYLLDNQDRWIDKDFYRELWWQRERASIRCGSIKLLLILKKYMLYYSHQWEKTAKDYRELLSVTDPLTDDDTILCNLFVCYNEKIHGKRSSDTDEFIIHSTNMQKSLTIKRDDFFQYEKEKQISCIHQLAMSLSIADDILIGLEYICTKGPLWLADYVINHWMDIHQEKFKQKYELPHPCIEFQIENYRLFPELPEIAIQRILQFINDINDFHSMQFVCKQWYTVLHEEIFWRDLYISRYGSYSGNMENINSWKILYFIKLEGNIEEKNDIHQKLVDATIQLRNYSANDILQLWEDLTLEIRWLILELCVK